MCKQGVLPVLVVAAGLMLLPATAGAATIQVDITPDNSTDDGFCTLREALTATSSNADVNGTDATADCDHDGGTGLDTITFAAGFVGNPAQAITLGQVLPDITGPLAIDAAAGPSCPAAPDPCVEVQGVAGSSVLIFNNAPNSSVRGLALTNGSNGINVIGTSTGFKLAQSWIGIKLDESSDPNTSTGITFGPTANGSDIGGTATADRNVFYANPTNLALGNGDAHLVRGNWFGVLSDGTAGSVAPVNNISVGPNGDDNTIGADDAGTPGVCDSGCNVVSRATGNGIDTDASPTLRLAVRGNFIGLDPGGTQDFGNNVGVELANTDSSTVGGATTASRNYIGGNNSRGVQISANSEDAIVRNNYVGLAASGAAAVPDNSSGIQVQASDGDAIIADNRFGGDGDDPFQALNIATGAAGVEVIGNTFGVGTGGEPLPMSNFAINVATAGHTIGGGGAGEGNVIGNVPTGIFLNSGADANTMLGNRIGVSASGADIGTTFGIRTTNISTVPTGNVIGGTTPASENVISNSVQDAVEIRGDGADGNQVLRNRGSGNAGLFLDLDPPGGFGNDANGPNAGIQAPTVNSARRGKDRVKGTGVPGTTVRVYRSEGPSGSSPTGLLKFLGEKVVGAAGGWKINPAGKLKRSWKVSANQTSSSDGSSEFALARKVKP